MFPTEHLHVNLSLTSSDKSIYYNFYKSLYLVDPGPFIFTTASTVQVNNYEKIFNQCKKSAFYSFASSKKKMGCFIIKPF